MIPFKHYGPQASQAFKKRLVDKINAFLSAQPGDIDGNQNDGMNDTTLAYQLLSAQNEHSQSWFATIFMFS